MVTGDKAPDAFRTIGELSADLGVPQHVLRYWESRFPQLRPLQRAGNRRYYRVADVALARRIHSLLGEQGYTVRGVQKLLAEKDVQVAPAPVASLSAQLAPPSATPPEQPSPALDIARLVELRDRLAAALAS